ncbi:hypothetical protein ACHAXS_000915 [Conticribra weissflogii]
MLILLAVGRKLMPKIQIMSCHELDL